MRRHPTSRYQEAALWREEMADWLDPGNRAVRAFFDQWRRAAERTSGSATFPKTDTTPQIISNIRRRIAMTEIFYLTSDVARFIYDASQLMPPHPILPEDFASSHGWLHFESPLQFDIVPGRNDMEMRGVMWTREPVGDYDVPGAVFWDLARTDFIERRIRSTQLYPRLFDGTHLSLLSMGTVTSTNLPWMIWRKDFDPKVDIADSIVDAMGLPSVQEALVGYYGDSQNTPFHVPIPKGAEILRDGTADGHWDLRTIEGVVVHMEPDRVARFMQCFFLLLNQKLPSLELSSRNIPKPWLQEMKRKWKHVSNSPITIVGWRKRETKPRDPDTEESGRHLHYRHVRRGHWRRNNRRKNPQTGEWYLYPIYVNATIVGSEDLPFRDRDVINVVYR